jgi:iron complex outermembrane receptor protein
MLPHVELSPGQQEAKQGASAVITTTRVRLAKTAILCGLSVPYLAATSAAHSQDAQAPLATRTAERQPEPETLETITVTGSNIRRSTFNETAPVQVIDRANIEASGARTVFDIVADLPVNVGSELNNEQNDLAGISQFNLRGLGVASTLTLVNGKRAGKSAIADGGGNSFFDINSLPLSAIKQLDLQTDGASAIYGSEAVAGVVNVITRKGFEGFEITAGYEQASNDAGSLSVAAGQWTENGGINIYATYYKQTANTRTDFPWLSERADHVGNLQTTTLSSANGAPGTYFIAQTDPLTGLAIQRAGARAFADPDCVAAGGILRGTTCHLDVADQNGVIPASERYQLFTEMEYALSVRSKVYAEGSLSLNDQRRIRGPGNYSNGLITGAQAGRILIPGDHPFNFFVENPADPTRLTYIGPQAWNNSIHQGAEISAQARILGNEFNGRRSPATRDAQINYYRGLGGLNVQLAERWNVDLSYMFSRSDWSEATPFDYNAPTVNQLILDGQFNPFGTRVSNPTLVSPKDGVSVAGLAPDVLATLLTPQTRTAQQTQDVIDAVVSGSLFELPAGPLGAAVGYQRRDERYEYRPGIWTATNTSGINGREFPIDGKLEVDALFVEAIIPVHDHIELQAALRSEDYGSTDSLDPKLAVRWDLTDAFAVRASYGSSFQAPSVRQQSEALSAAGTLDDPAGINPATGILECNSAFGQQTGGAVTRTVGGPGLKPQSADNINLGAVFRPIAALQLAVDYWSYDYTDLIGTEEGSQAILINDCRDDGIPNDPRVERSPGGNVTRVTSNFINTASVVADGLDLSGRFSTALGGLGDLDLAVSGTYLNKFEFRNGPGSPVVDIVGSRNELNQFSSLPRWRANTMIGWSRNALFGSVTVNYTHSYLNDANANFEIPSFTSVDLQLGATLDFFGTRRASTLVAGAKNVFDEDPPTLGRRQRPGYDAQVAAIRGRIVYLNLKQSF